MNTKVRLQISWLLIDRFKLNADGLEEKFRSLQLAWQEQAGPVINGLETVTGLAFLKNHIDVFLINPDDAPSISFPVIVKTFDDQDKTLRVLVHELIHNLMWDNVQQDNWSKKICQQYSNEDGRVARHVAVHAILEALYTDALKRPEEVEKDIAGCKGRPAYEKAWEIVRREGYKNIIAKLQKI